MAKGPSYTMTDAGASIPIAGYSDRLSLRPGETIEFKVSSTSQQPYTARLSRSISADPNPQGMGVVEESMESIFPEMSFPSRHQPFSPGSYAISNEPLVLTTNDGFILTAIVFSTLQKKQQQVVMSVANIALYLDENGACAFRVGDQIVSTDTPLKSHHWYQIEAVLDLQNNQISVRQTPLNTKTIAPAQSSKRIDASLPAKTISAPMLVAASFEDGKAVGHFNGKIEAPTIYSGTTPDHQNALVCWDFSKDISSTAVKDTGLRHLDATLINFPARAMTSSQWDASEMCWQHAPDHYACVHFHDDDIYDFGWETDFTFTAPTALPSGVYVMRICCGEIEDAMPFFVCAPRGKPTAKLCVLIPTFTYSVYGNHARPDFDVSWKQRISEWGAYPHNPAEHREYGLSTYNFHTDGSGICHASHLRPLFNLRPGYLTFGYGEGSGLRHFQADSHLISWLHHMGTNYDIITDTELHDEGYSAIKDYAAVTTTTHPEYHTKETLDALQEYRDSGGNLIYLGGNGFYWRVALHKEASGVIEIRRAEDGIRAWAAEPGEYYNAFDGSYGGLWRRSGRPPQMLVGVGFSAQGEFNGSYYQRKCVDPQYDWVFAGVEEGVIGDFGFSGGGAAGFELDRAEHRLGTPENAVILARSEGHGKDFIMVPEEQLTHITNWSGQPTQDLIRADMVYFSVPGGGSVFATGSITFCGSLPWNDFKNNVSKILSNVIEKMID